MLDLDLNKLYIGVDKSGRTALFSGEPVEQRDCFWDNGEGYVMVKNPGLSKGKFKVKLVREDGSDL